MDLPHGSEYAFFFFFFSHVVFSVCTEISWLRHMEEGSGGWYSEVSVYLAAIHHEIGNFASYVAFLFSNIPVSLSAYCIFSIYLPLWFRRVGGGILCFFK